MRGKEPYDVVAADLSRITPAYAGKRQQPKGFVKTGEDHPRLCGEKVMLEPWHMPSWGSPPPMRGKAILCKTPGCTNGITPAYAGKRFRC